MPSVSYTGYPRLMCSMNTVHRTEKMLCICECVPFSSLRQKENSRNETVLPKYESVMLQCFQILDISSYMENQKTRKKMKDRVYSCALSGKISCYCRCQYNIVYCRRVCAPPFCNNTIHAQRMYIIAIAIAYTLKCIRVETEKIWNNLQDFLYSRSLFVSVCVFVLSPVFVTS